MDRATISIPIPVELGPDQVGIRPMDIEVRAARSEGAPIAIKHGSATYRTHADRLWVRREPYVQREVRGAYRGRRAQRLIDYLGDDYFDWGVDGHPIAGTTGIERALSFVNSHVKPALEAALKSTEYAKALKRAERTMLIDGELWLESSGPLIILGRTYAGTGLTAEWSTQHNPLGGSGIRPNCFEFRDAVTIDEIAERMSLPLTWKGERELTISAPLPDFRFDALASAIEESAENAYKYHRMKRLESVDRAVLLNVVELREIMQRRYPDIALSYAANRMTRHDELDYDRIDIAPADEFIQPLKKSLEFLPRHANGPDYTRWSLEQLFVRHDVVRARTTVPLPDEDAKAFVNAFGSVR